MMPLLAPLAFALLQAGGPQPLAYRFDEVRHSVQLWPGGDAKAKVPAATGAPARSGDIVRTGWWGGATLSVPGWSSRFQLFGGTRARLASGEPGVLLEVQGGRITAIFDALAGAPRERKVAVPGALLAVRGTRYGVEVGNGGRVTLAVFRGVVEVQPRPSGAAFRVSAGAWARFGAGLRPEVQDMPDPQAAEGAWSRGRSMGASRGAENRSPEAGAHGHHLGLGRNARP